MKRIAACVVLVSLLGCSSTTEPESPPPPATPTPFEVDSAMAVTESRIQFVTEAGAGGADSPACRTAIRDYYIVASLYAIAVAAVRLAPNAVNIATAAMMAIAVMNATSNVYNNCSATRPA